VSRRRGTDYDVVVIGAGHNALVTAAYLAQADYRVAVLERRHIVGGAVATEELVPGYRFDIGGSAHILIRLTPIVEELGLEAHGLEYLELDPIFYAPFEDGQSLTFFRSEDQTVEELERVFPGEGEAYRRFVQEWRPFARMVKEAFLSAPGPLELGRRFVLGSTFRKDWQRALGVIRRPYGEVVDDYFREERVKAPLVWMAAQSGPPPFEPFSAPFLLWQPLYHDGGVARPRGGSGMLTQALKRAIEAKGGIVKVGTPVERIITEGSDAVAVETAEGRVSARAIVAGIHAIDTYHRLLPPEHRPAAAGSMRAGNGFGAIGRFALSSPVEYTAEGGDRGRIGLQLLCRDRRQIEGAFADSIRRRMTDDPPLVAMTFSAVDPSLAPPGGEVLWLWGQYFPYELEGRSWDEAAPQLEATLLDAFERYAPGTREKVVGSLIQHPLWLERELGMHRGNVMHLEMSIDQMFMLRPFPGASGYRTHLRGLYLTGASTHPGGGIMGASGRNAARVVLRDLERRRV
jgi:phytoene dehydrogenase-like protein